MGALVLDSMDDATQWMALAPDGVTPSTQLTAASDPQEHAYGLDNVSMRLTATAAAGGHTVRRSLAAPARDLSGFTELRLSLRADRSASPDGGPFFLRLRLGSATLPLSDMANRWHRLLPVGAADRWETVKLGIDDLDASIRGAVDAVELRCLDIDGPFVAHIDDLTAVAPELVADVDRALEQRLRGITIAGEIAPAVVRSSSEPIPAVTALDITQLDLAYAPERLYDLVEPRDYTSGGGLRLMPGGAPYDVTYAVAPIAADRAAQASLLEQVVGRLGPANELVSDGDRLPVELVVIPPRDRVGGVAGPDPVLFFRVGARAWGSQLQPSRGVADIVIETNRLEAV